MTSPIGSIGSSTTPTGAAAPAGSGNSSATGMAGLVQPNTFLNMLVDEIKYQDPLNPTSSSSFMDQLAQLSQVEQLNNVSSSMQIGEAASLIGKTVTGTDASGSSVSGTVTDVKSGENGPTLDVGGVYVGLSSVAKIGP
ncbi:MAG: flagellar hook capping protein [Actinomycetota bacterium]|nr:flagellar hook capping protein [Actinomycetota bacterium]